MPYRPPSPTTTSASPKHPAMRKCPPSPHTISAFPDAHATHNRRTRPPSLSPSPYHIPSSPHFSARLSRANASAPVTPLPPPPPPPPPLHRPSSFISLLHASTAPSRPSSPPPISPEPRPHTPLPTPTPRPPSQLHIEALHLPPSASRGTWARLTLHGDTLGVTETLTSPSPIFARPFNFHPPHVDRVIRVASGAPQTRLDSAVISSGRGPRDIDRMYVVHLHTRDGADVPFASVPVPMRLLARNPGEQFIVPLVAPSTSSSTNLSDSDGDDLAARHNCQIALTYEPVAKGGEAFVTGRSLCIEVRVSALRRRGKLLKSRVPLVVAVYRQTAPDPPAKQRWVLVSLTPVATRSRTGSAYLTLPTASIPYVWACAGDPDRPLRVALYRVDDSDRYRVIGFHETSVAALEKAPIVARPPHPLQGRYYDDNVGSVRVLARHDSNTLRVTMAIDLLSTNTLISATSRPSAHAAAFPPSPTPPRAAVSVDVPHATRPERAFSTLSASGRAVPPPKARPASSDLRAGPRVTAAAIAAAASAAASRAVVAEMHGPTAPPRRRSRPSSPAPARSVAAAVPRTSITIDASSPSLSSSSDSSRPLLRLTSLRRSEENRRSLPRWRSGGGPGADWCSHINTEKKKWADRERPRSASTTVWQQ